MINLSSGWLQMAATAQKDDDFSSGFHLLRGAHHTMLVFLNYRMNLLLQVR
jgi:hypothetical protein